MRYLTTRRVVVWTAVPLIMAHVGCAARGLQVPSGQPPSVASETDRKACESYARATSAASPAEAYADDRWDPRVALLLPLALFMAPIWIPDMVSAARATEAARQAQYDAALQKCFEAIAQGPLPPEMKLPARPWNPAGSSEDGGRWANRHELLLGRFPIPQ